MPVWRLLGSDGPRRGHSPAPRSYRPGGPFEYYRAWRSSRRAPKRRRHWAIAPRKLEVCLNGPYSHGGLQEDDAAVVEIVAECRRAVGPELVLMVDVAYAWSDAETALRVIERLAPYRIEFIETPIDIDDLEGHAFLHHHSPIPIAAGEWQNTHFEFLDLADRGLVDVLQPDVGRVGGLTEANASLFDRRREGPGCHPALLEDRAGNRGRRTPRDGDRALPLHRVLARRTRRIPAPPGATGRGPPSRRRTARAAHKARARHQAEPRRPPEVRGGRPWLTNGSRRLVADPDSPARPPSPAACPGGVAALRLSVPGPIPLLLTHSAPQARQRNLFQ